MKEILDEPENEDQEKSATEFFLESIKGLVFLLLIIFVGIFLPLTVILVLLIILS